MNNLLLIDTNAIAHCILQKFERGDYNSFRLDDVIHVNMVYLLSGALIHDLDQTPIHTIFAMDAKPYWREYALKKIGVNYKGKRQSRPERTNLLGRINESIKYTLHTKFKKPIFDLFSNHTVDGYTVGYEADDLAAGIILKNNTKYKNIYVLTDDTDWLPFTTYTNVTWLAVTHRKPRVRTHTEVLEWVKSSHTFTHTKERSRFTISNPLDIWRFKSYFGDTSDNLNGDKKDKTEGRYTPFIDLFNPHLPFLCWKEPDFDCCVEVAKGKPQTPVTKQTVLNLADSIPLIIDNFTPQDKKLWVETLIF
jgi:5'-3' exonuclease